MTAGPMVCVEAVTKLHPQSGGTDVRALDDVSLAIAPGEFVAIMGPSGSGKSTLLSLMGGLDVPTDGRIAIEGRPLGDMSDDVLTVFRRRRIGFVFQFFNLLPTLTAAENVALPLLLDGRRLRDVAPRVDALLDRVGLARRSRHRADELSGGEMQRVAIARALVTEPALVLADEPTGNLDSRNGEDILRLLRRATDRDGHTVVLVTHDRRAADYADRVITLRDGRVAHAADDGARRAAEG